MRRFATGVFDTCKESNRLHQVVSTRMHGELQILKHFVDFASLLGWATRDLVVLLRIWGHAPGNWGVWLTS
jgi:hypothetical protein